MAEQKTPNNAYDFVWMARKVRNLHRQCDGARQSIATTIEQTDNFRLQNMLRPLMGDLSPVIAELERIADNAQRLANKSRTTTIHGTAEVVGEET